YFLPLALATVCYLVLESRAKEAARERNEKGKWIYYFLPLALATVCYLVLESRAKEAARERNEKGKW
ncbi:hypothetical protein CP989_25975, partial [Enterobacter hormaechei]